MNRKIKQIDPNKWYHLESLKKYFSDCKMQTDVRRNDNNKEFTFVTFKCLWLNYVFITHPKTKRLKRITPAALAEIGFNY